MQVVWLDEAKVLFKEAISFGFLAFGEKAVIRFVDEVQRTNERLSVFPRLGMYFTLQPVAAAICHTIPKGLWDPTYFVLNSPFFFGSLSVSGDWISEPIR